MVKYLYPQQEKEVMSKYILTQRSKNARHSLEYAVMNQLWDELEQIIELLSSSSNPADKEWATMYDLIYIRKQQLLSPIEQLNKVEVFKPKETEMQIMKSLVKGYIYNDLGERFSIFLHIEDAEANISNLKSSFLKDSFTVRLGLLMGYVTLLENRILESRNFNTAILKQDFFEDVKATANHNLGLSYFFEDYQVALNYFNKALDFYLYHDHTIRIRQVRLNLSLLMSYWNIKFDYTQPIGNHSSFLNYTFYLIKKGELALANEYLSKTSVGELAEWDKAFYYYYKGLLTSELSLYYSSVELFLKIDDYFHAQLPLLELQKLGENEIALRILSTRRK
ncbi:hypothetical protein J2S11_003688 [Bacillus horti]|uniref:Tetratricopeptide repeat protein n=2 Tax=Caldalkalibacillus horti TaxID=77523 RepID=A0ABT9W3F0_9BACI|nr:hypothetical protein [Bacillus horti]